MILAFFIIIYTLPNLNSTGNFSLHFHFKVVIFLKDKNRRKKNKRKQCFMFLLKQLKTQSFSLEATLIQNKRKLWIRQMALFTEVKFTSEDLVRLVKLHCPHETAKQCGEVHKYSRCITGLPRGESSPCEGGTPALQLPPCSARQVPCSGP